MKILIFLVLSLLLINCNKDKKKIEENNVEKIEVIETKEEKIDDVVLKMKKLNFLTRLINYLKGLLIVKKIL